ncbi:MAG: hypothetical protein DRQ60_10540 [Gammaproteobacteria bacterium]|nr:MAG: hypothetical protein DRQ54_04510 [Gammaproteobacteria bacterium]RLA10973.1 MAG: hypothetical protein DRQ60_10540 [Gammaproteobacteria bacterium]RLA14654.1 MAG: hypothetical protein DRQ52_03680 [Gammaproteobacteria bacterium]
MTTPESTRGEMLEYWIKGVINLTVLRNGLCVLSACALLSGGQVRAADEAVTVYRSKGSDGSIEFSDQAGRGAKPVVIETPMIQPSNGLKLPPSPTVEEDFSYSVLAISTPGADATFRNEEADVIAVSGKLSPGLRKGDRVILLVDGVASGVGVRSPFFQTGRLERGAHSLQLQIQDEKDQIVIQSEIITINVHRTAVRAQHRSGN